MTPRGSTARQLLACVLVAAAGGVAACAGGASPPPAVPAPAVPAPSSGPAVRFGGTDLAWIQITVAMDEQIAPLLALPATHSRNNAVKRLNARVDTFSEAELRTLRKLSAEAGLPAANPHEGMPMTGMVQADDVKDAAATSGPAFDTLYLTLLQAHLEQGLSLATKETTAGVEPVTLALAKQVRASRETCLPTVRTLAAG